MCVSNAYSSILTARYHSSHATVRLLLPNIRRDWFVRSIRPCTSNNLRTLPYSFILYTARLLIKQKSLIRKHQAPLLPHSQVNVLMNMFISNLTIAFILQVIQSYPIAAELMLNLFIIKACGCTTINYLYLRLHRKETNLDFYTQRKVSPIYIQCDIYRESLKETRLALLLLLIDYLNRRTARLGKCIHIVKLLETHIWLALLPYLWIHKSQSHTRIW